MTAAAKALSREYETIYVLRPDLGREAAENVANRVVDVVSKQGGRLTLVESWGRRRLAYPVHRHRRGTYVYLKYLGGGPLVQELERQLRMLDGVLKYQTVKLRDEVDSAAVTVSPEDVKFEAVDLPAEPDPEDSPEHLLGLDDAPPARRGERHGGDEERADGEDASGAVHPAADGTEGGGDEAAPAPAVEKQERS